MASSLIGVARQVVMYPNPILRKATQSVVFAAGQEGRRLIAPAAGQAALDLIATVQEEQGLGLAAPQIGHSLSMFVMALPITRSIQSLLPPASSTCAHSSKQAGTAVGSASRADNGVGVDIQVEAGACAGARALTHAEAQAVALANGAKGRRRGGPMREWAARTVGRFMDQRINFRVIVNPELVSRSEDVALGLEGCLSIPEYNALIRRPTSIQVKYFDHLGNEYHDLISGFPAVVFQHEFDHLDGMVHTDREKQAYVSGSRQQLVAAAHAQYIAHLRQYYGISLPSRGIAPDDF